MSRDDDSIAVVENPGTVTEAQPEQGVTAENVPVSTDSSNTDTTPPASPVPATPEKAEPTEAEQAAAFEEFKAKVDAAIAEVDLTTGNIPDGLVADVKAAYVALPLARNKTAGRKLLDDKMKESLTKPPFDPYRAKAYLDLNEACKTTGATRETVAKPPVDPTEAFVKEVTAHWIATSLLIPGPEVDPTYVTKSQELARSLEPEAKAYKAYLTQLLAWNAKPEAERGEEPKAPEVSEVILHAAKIAQGRSGRRSAPKASTGTAKASASSATYSGPKRDVKAHIREAFADQPVGTFLKIGEIVKFPSKAYEGASPSGGAVNAALDSAKFAQAVPNIVKATEGGVNGARKIAA